MSDDLSSAARLIAVLDHLGLGRVHIATQIPGDIAELAALHPDHLAGIVLCAPFYLDPAPFILLADRLLMVSGEHGDKTRRRRGLVTHSNSPEWGRRNHDHAALRLK